MRKEVVEAAPPTGCGLPPFNTRSTSNSMSPQAMFLGGFAMTPGTLPGSFEYQPPATTPWGLCHVQGVVMWGGVEHPGDLLGCFYSTRTWPDATLAG